MSILHLDFETFSRTDLKTAGMYRYMEDPDFEVLCTAYTFDSLDISLWVPYNAFDLPEELVAELIKLDACIQPQCPWDIVQHVKARGVVAAHNAAFERRASTTAWAKRVGFPEISIDQCHCTMAKCAAHGVPHSLEEASTALGTYAKNKAGVNDMRALTKPRKPTKANPDTRWYPHTAPDKFLNMYRYCMDDVRAERDLDNNIPHLSKREVRVYQMDQRINDRGVRVDLAAVDDVQSLVTEYKSYLGRRCLEWTGVVPSQTAKLASWVRTHGFSILPDLQKDTVEWAVQSPACPADVKNVLKLYSTYNMKAVSKFTAMESSVCNDGRIHGMFRYHGANTGRWSSTIVQLQNLFRPVIGDPDVAIAAFRERALQWIRDLYPGVDPMKVFASTVRGMLIPAEGFDLLFPDYSGIESRATAWLFDEEWKLKAFREFDVGRGFDLYVLAYARAFNVDPATVTKALRQIGKVMELALGFEGGVGAFVTMTKTYNVNLEGLTRAALPNIPQDVLEEAARWYKLAKKQGRTSGIPEDQFLACDSLKRLWRRNHPRIVKGWKQLKAAELRAVEKPGSVTKIDNGKVQFKVEGRWLRMLLPSGRSLWYLDPTVREEVTVDEDTGEERTNRYVSYYGLHSKTRRWQRVASYGGLKCENAVQGLARDRLVDGMFDLEEAGYDLIGSVHDEPMMEILEGFGSLEDAGRLMCLLKNWCEGLPLAIEGHRAKRYRK